MDVHLGRIGSGPSFFFAQVGGCQCDPDELVPPKGGKRYLPSYATAVQTLKGMGNDGNNMTMRQAPQEIRP